MNTFLKLDGFKKLSDAYLLLIVFGLCIVVLSELTNIDFLIADYYFDTQQQMFAWKNSWFAQKFMHVYVKNTIIVIALTGLVFVLLDALRHFKFIDGWVRVRLRFVAFAAIFIPLIISVLKQTSALHCPWDVQRYGGTAPYLRLFDAIPANMEAGHCFPAGHASTGLWLAALCVFWLPHRPRAALVVCMAGLGAGFLLGWVQQMRGAHFLTHTLASIWVASAILLIMLSFSKSFFHCNTSLRINFVQLPLP